MFAEFRRRFHLPRLERFVHLSMNVSIQAQYACKQRLAVEMFTEICPLGFRLGD
jgi:hypothetical protein